MPATNAPEQTSVRELYRNKEQTTRGVEAPNNGRDELAEKNRSKGGRTKLKTGIHITDTERKREKAGENTPAAPQGGRSSEVGSKIRRHPASPTAPPGAPRRCSLVMPLN